MTKRHQEKERARERDREREREGDRAIASERETDAAYKVYAIEGETARLTN